MATNSYMPSDDIGKVLLLEHLALTLPKYTSTFGISDAEMASIKADTLALRRAYTYHHQVQSFAQDCTAQKNHLRDGGSGKAEWPVMPEFIAVDTVPPGVIPRLSTLVAGIKAHKNYTEAIGRDLRLIGTEIVKNPDSWKPVLKSKSSAGHPVICWTKGYAAEIEIWADRGDGNDFVFYTINSEPDTLDKTPLPPKGAGVNWKYKAIYRLHNEQVGQWSDVMSISVGG